MMSLGDMLPGLLIGLVVCGIFAVVVFVIAKKDNTKLEELLAQIPAEKQEELKAENYQPLDGAGIKCATRGLLAAIDTKGDMSTVRLVF